MILAIIVYMALVVVQSLGCVWLFATPWTAALQAALPFTVSHILLKLMSIELVMPSNHLVLCHPLLFLPSGFPSIRVFSNKLALCLGSQSIRASASTSASTSASASASASYSYECSGLISFRTDWFALLVVQGTPRVFSMALVNLRSLPGKGARSFWDTFCDTMLSTSFPRQVLEISSAITPTLREH